MAKSEDKMEYKLALKTATDLTTYLSPYCEAVTICGSIRRKEKMVADIDVVVLNPTKDLATLELIKTNEILVQGERKISFNILGIIQVDIMIAYDKAEFAPMTLHCTGSKWSNIKMRRKARDMGLKLNEYGLWSHGEREPCHTEEDIYKHLGLAYVEPEQRG